MNDTPTHVQNLESDGRYGKEVLRNKISHVVVLEGAPSLRGRLMVTDHRFGHRRLGNLDPKLQSSQWMRGAPQRGLFRLIMLDQIPELEW